ncbi:MAG: serine hydrolase domain-containing protein [Planctomycetota bacterium]
MTPALLRQYARLFIPVLFVISGSLASRGHAQADLDGLGPALEAIRAEHDLPAMSGAIVTAEGIRHLATVGVRKKNDPDQTPATDDDLWHLGSCGKAITATLIARLVEAGTLRFDQTLAESFPDAADELPESHRGITLHQLLTHRSGLPANFTLLAYVQETDPAAARRKVFRETIDTPLAHAPGSAYLYSNWGYTLAGHVAERAAGKPFEQLLRDEVFGPLGMTTAGFGGTGTLGQIDQPWPHTGNGRPTLINGPAMDNLPVMAPAGTIHMSMRDWAKFVAEHLKGRQGQSDFLSRDTFRRLHTPAEEVIGDDHYALGWNAVKRGWAGDARALNHGGDNTMNHATAWLAPARGFAVLVATNQSRAQAANDAAATALILAWLNAQD